MIRKLLYCIGQLFFLPHVALFLFSKEKENIVLDLYARRPSRSNMLRICYDLTYKLLENSYFRTLFYFRTDGIFAKVLRVLYPRNNSFIIDVTTKIEGGLVLAHPYATILNAQSIGKNVYVNHLVTIGERNNQKPIIGNNVELHANCIVIGGITIGDNAIIGAGAVVINDVPENAVAVGNPARII